MAVRLHSSRAARPRGSSLLRSLSLENIRFALNSIRVQKLRSFLTLLGIVMGVATVITMVSLVAGFNSSISAAFDSVGSNKVEIQKIDPRYGMNTGPVPPEQFRRPNFVLDDVETLKRNLTLAKAISPERVAGSLSIKNSKGDEAYLPTVYGVMPEYAIVNNLELEDGRFFVLADISHATRTCVIGYDIVKALFDRADPIGREIYFRGVPMRVVGVAKKIGTVMGQSMDNNIFIPLSAFDEMYPWARRWGSLNIKVVPRGADQVPDLIDEITTVIRVKRGLKANEPNNFSVTSSDSGLESQKKITNGIAAVMILIASIALIVGGVGVMNIMLVSVTERTREIGVRKALGATRKDIAAQFLVEAVTLTGFGGSLGIVLGISGGYLVKLLSAGMFPAEAPLWSIALGFGVSTGVGLAAGLWPAVKAASQDPIEALRYE